MRCLFCSAERKTVLSDMSVLRTVRNPHLFECTQLSDGSGCGLRYYLEGRLTMVEIDLAEEKRKFLREKITLANSESKSIIVLLWESVYGSSASPVELQILVEKKPQRKPRALRYARW